MTVTLTDAANYICGRGGWQTTNLALQKILYLAHMAHLGERGEPLVAGHFEAWEFGPVHPGLYQRVKAFGSKPIPNIFWGARALAGTPEGETLSDACDNLINETPGQLVANTHWSGGAWARNYVRGGRGIVIPEGHIIDEYNARIARPERTLSVS